MTNMRTYILLFIALWSTNLSFAQQLDPVHYPPEAEWKQLYVRNSDTVITCMRYYFRSEDTLYFREHPSLKVVKYALADVYPPTFSVGKDYQFQKKGARIATRMFYSRKLDRFYDYYLHVPLLTVNARKIEPAKEIEKPQDIDTMFSWNKPKMYNPDATFGEIPQKILYDASGCTYYLEDYYFMSNGLLFFRLSGKPDVYSLPLNMIKRSEGIYDLGRDLDLGHRYKYRKNTRRMLGFSIIFYPTYIVTLPIGIFRSVRHARYRNAKMLSCSGV
jgi:hypothetical protein